MSTRGCGSLPRRFASTAAHRSDRPPAPSLRKTSGPSPCSSCDGSGWSRH